MEADHGRFYRTRWEESAKAVRRAIQGKVRRGGMEEESPHVAGKFAEEEQKVARETFLVQICCCSLCMEYIAVFISRAYACLLVPVPSLKGGHSCYETLMLVRGRWVWRWRTFLKVVKPGWFLVITLGGYRFRLGELSPKR